MSLNDDIEQWLISEQAHFRATPANANGRRPHVTLSYAQSWDGSITTAPGRTVVLSSAEGMQMTHQLRSLHDGILVGIGTVLADDPQLTVREWTGDDPQPIVLDSQLRIPSSSRLCRNDVQTCWVLTTRINAATPSGCELIVVPDDDDGHVNLHQAMEILYRRGIRHLMIEGGASVITAFLRAGLADAAVLTIAPVFIGGYNAIGELGNPDARSFPRFVALHSRQLGNEIIVWGRLAYTSSDHTDATT